ncbi:hypothetical protein ASPVEDRAFT_146957 [Aspergillus versicolor CBS 583.65]|uniref:Rhodopsin domain-containing protein n=1 Tax=Aspergillus versicolor CBS 583.65 TaxID=1036611 RepID=A0A1L9P833_ASPVE|nr:uncharacterized protein ASPVEDRAFT_146957 [Aspergillus versicolor CBS 583.65]OJI97613.1 hypothetical protein ASPVEDRAFT_146957 [Aspergillus versicolor CBS 583.65]
MSRYPKDSNAPAVIVLTRFLLVTLILGCLARLGTKWWKFGTFFRDDYYAMLAMVASIAQAVAVSIAVNLGYGSPISQLSDSQVAGIFKAQYASTLFYVFGIGLSQLSFLCFVQYLASRKNYSFMAQQIAIAVVAVVGVFGSAFQCRPRQWDYIHDRCYNREAWFIYLSASMILAEIAIIAHAVVVLVNVQTSCKRRLNLTSVFLFRVVVPGALIAQIILIHNNINTPDPTSHTWSIAVCTQLALCLSNVTASTPQFVPILRSLQSTGMRLDGITRYTHTSSAQGSRSRYLFSARTGGDSVHELDNIPLATTKTTVTGGHPSNYEERENEEDDGSQSSQAGIIRATRTFDITEEHVR